MSGPTNFIERLSPWIPV